MPIVRIPTPLRSHTDGKDAIEVEGATVGAVLSAACASFPELKSRLFDGDELRRFVNVYVNNEDIRYMDDLDSPVKPGDDISIIPAIAGG